MLRLSHHTETLITAGSLKHTAIQRTTICALLVLCCAGGPDIATWHRHIRDAYSGERARNMVVWLDQHWRLTGNAAFNASIEYVASVLEDAGYTSQDQAGADTRLTYRMERRPMGRQAWQPLSGLFDLLSSSGSNPVLRFETNRSMVAINSYSTPASGVVADIVYVGDGSKDRFEGLDVAGKIVYGKARASSLFRTAVQQYGAIGVVSYSPWDVHQPEVNQQSIQFSSIPNDSSTRAWGILLSFAAHRQLMAALEKGPVRAKVAIETRFSRGDELTLVADVHGTTHAHERFVFSAHLDEPGANDNASGVAALAEGARVLADLVNSGRISPDRTITMIWGSEIRSTGRYLSEDSLRAAGVKWGVSLDMVGEDTEKTGGTFLIEKMPDPSAVWTRGSDQHTEWGSRPLTVDDMTPHYLNDFVLRRCNEQANLTDWVVKTNPYEGGSDHVPFLRAGKPGLLLWHFTDVFYHTDGDRPDKVSARTLANVGTCALVSAVTLTSADSTIARQVIEELKQDAMSRLAAEYELSRVALVAGGDPAEQALIVRTWTEWYRDAMESTADIEVGGSSEGIREAIALAVSDVVRAGEDFVNRLLTEGG